MTAVLQIQRAIETRRLRSPPRPLSPTVEELIHEMTETGAIMTLPQRPPVHFLVGGVRWVDPQRIFWFTAFGDALRDAHVLEFDDVQPFEEFAVAFVQRDQLVGYLTRIEHAGLDDPDDYRIAWRLWQEVAPLRVQLIERCCAALVAANTRRP